MYTHILLPTDGSNLSAKAITETIRLAKAVGATVTAINVVPEYEVMISEGLVIPKTASYKKRFEAETQRRGQRILSEVRAEAARAGVACECVAVAGANPYEAIIKQAKRAKCDLIAMASHGRKGLSGILLGSETTAVLTHSTIPVLVIR